ATSLGSDGSGPQTSSVSSISRESGRSRSASSSFAGAPTTSATASRWSASPAPSVRSPSPIRLRELPERSRALRAEVTPVWDAGAMVLALSLVLYGVAGLGLVVLALQLLAVWRHVAVARDPELPVDAPGISILKPLCGDDDDLAANLEAFATLDYPRFELLLGVEHMLDAAVPIALAAQSRWPDRVRVVLPTAPPGLNPRVSQLMPLAAEARHELVVVSDSNVRPPADYLHGIAAHLADPTVGLVTHAIVGAGAERQGSTLDFLHLSTAVGPGVIAAK